MSRSKASGYVLKSSDAPVILGMSVRGDRDHDIAAWFGVNQGRIAEVKDGKFGTPAIAAGLPPKGPPGIKGRRMRAAASKALEAIASGKGDASEILKKAIAQYDANET